MDKRICNLINNIEKISTEVRLSIKQKGYYTAYSIRISEEFAIFVEVYNDNSYKLYLAALNNTILTSNEADFIKDNLKPFDFIRKHKLEYTFVKTIYINKNNELTKKYNCFIDEDYLIQLEYKGINLEIPKEYERMFFTENLNHSDLIKILQENFTEDELLNCYLDGN